MVSRRFDILNILRTCEMLFVLQVILISLPHWPLTQLFTIRRDICYFFKDWILMESYSFEMSSKHIWRLEIIYYNVTNNVSFGCFRWYQSHPKWYMAHSLNKLVKISNSLTTNYKNGVTRVIKKKSFP